MFKVSSKGIGRKNIEGTLYLLDLDVDGKRVVKFGVTTRKIEERVCEILTSHWKQYRVFPRCYVKRHRKVDDVYEKEKVLLEGTKKWKYVSKKKFGGCDELVELELDVAAEVYEMVYGGDNVDVNEIEAWVASRQEQGTRGSEGIREGDSEVGAGDRCSGVDVDERSAEEGEDGTESEKE